MGGPGKATHRWDWPAAPGSGCSGTILVFQTRGESQLPLEMARGTQWPRSRPLAEFSQSSGQGQKLRGGLPQSTHSICKDPGFSLCPSRIFWLPGHLPSSCSNLRPGRPRKSASAGPRVPPPSVVKLITSPSLCVTLSLGDLMIFHPWSLWN